MKINLKTRLVFAFALTLSPIYLWGQGSRSILPIDRSAPDASKVLPVNDDEATVTSLQGKISLKRKNDARISNSTSITPFNLIPGDQILTGTDGHAVITMPDGSQIRLDPNSSFQIKKETPLLISLFLAAGKLWADVAHVPDRSFRVETVEAVAAVRGTEFSVSVFPTGITAAEVYSGAVALQALKDGVPLGKEGIVLPGERLEASLGKLSKISNFLSAPKNRSTISHQLESENARKTKIEYQLKAILESAQENNDENKVKGITTALETEDIGRMKKAVMVFGSGNQEDLDFLKMQNALENAFQKGNQLKKLKAQDSRQSSSVQGMKLWEKAMKRQLDKDLAKWSVNREMGLEAQSQAMRSAIAQSGASSVASPAQLSAAQTGAQAQSEQDYFETRDKIRNLQRQLPSIIKGAAHTSRGANLAKLILPPNKWSQMSNSQREDYLNGSQAQNRLEQGLSAAMMVQQTALGGYINGGPDIAMAKQAAWQQQALNNGINNIPAMPMGGVAYAMPIPPMQQIPTAMQYSYNSPYMSPPPSYTSVSGTTSSIYTPPPTMTTCSAPICSCNATTKTCSCSCL